MVFSKLVRPIAGIVALASAPALLAFAVYAQTAPPAPGQAPQAGQMSPAEPVPAPAVKAPPGGYNDPAAANEGAGGSANSGSAANAPGSSDVLLGLDVVGKDGKKLGQVAGVKSGSDGKLREIHVKTGGFLGFGGKTVAIPAGKISQKGEQVEVAMSTEEIGKLPKLEEQS
jgi:sporulation protein YlmC with PRC-barrel domain